MDDLLQRIRPKLLQVKWQNNTLRVVPKGEMTEKLMRKIINATTCLLIAGLLSACGSKPITLSLVPEVESNMGKPKVSIETTYPDDTEVQIFITASSPDKQDIYGGTIATVKNGHAEAVLDYNGDCFPNDKYLVKCIVDPYMQDNDLYTQISSMSSNMEKSGISGTDGSGSGNSDGYYSIEKQFEITDSVDVSEDREIKLKLSADIAEHVEQKLPLTTFEAAGANEVEDGKYSVIVNLTFDGEYSAKSAGMVLKLNSDDLANFIGSEHPEVQKMDFLWRVPYLGRNLSKFSYERRDGAMYATDKVLGF